MFYLEYIILNIILLCVDYIFVKNIYKKNDLEKHREMYQEVGKIFGVVAIAISFIYLFVILLLNAQQMEKRYQILLSELCIVGVVWLIRIFFVRSFVITKDDKIYVQMGFGKKKTYEIKDILFYEMDTQNRIIFKFQNGKELKLETIQAAPILSHRIERKIDENKEIVLKWGSLYRWIYGIGLLFFSVVWIASILYQIKTSLIVCASLFEIFAIYETIARFKNRVIFSGDSIISKRAFRKDVVISMTELKGYEEKKINSVSYIYLFTEKERIKIPMLWENAWYVQELIKKCHLR